MMKPGLFGSVERRAAHASSSRLDCGKAVFSQGAPAAVLLQRWSSGTSSGSTARSRTSLPTSQVAGSERLGGEGGRMVRRIALLAFLMLAVAFAAASALAASPSATPPPRAGSPALPSAEDIFARHERAMGRLPSLVARWSGTVVDD